MTTENTLDDIKVSFQRNNNAKSWGFIKVYSTTTNASSD